ncbi:MAG: energy-coupling factor ABC transporter permease [Desulfobacteraceae bacterium]|nr:energy-coupling factor ABC transporter permease [Desulfobacteraceae bacterium]
MHMADALLSPVVGGGMWAVSAGTIAYCSSKVHKEMDDSKIPLMGVLGAFIFAAQMVNFSIPVTGSSGHLGGGLILSVLLGPYAAFLTIASVLMVQALFFADGGLLALGCNIFNLGFFPAFIAYPLLYKRIIGSHPTAARISAASIIAAIVGLQLGSFAVVLETTFSGISSLSFPTFVALMQPIHLAIGIVEGLVTAMVITFVYKARPEILQSTLDGRVVERHSVRNVALAFLAATVVTGGVVSWFASKNPDGLEWAIKQVTGQEELKEPDQGLYAVLKGLQQKTAFLPDYTFKNPADSKKETALPETSRQPNTGDLVISPGHRPSVNPIHSAGTSLAGLVGGTLTLGLACLTGFLLKRRNQTK